MRAAVRAGIQDIRIADVPDPAIIDATDAVVRVLMSAVCGTDLWGYRGPEAIPPGPRAGHEFLGVVTEVGREVTRLKPGRLVLAPFMWADGDCAACDRGLPTSCSVGGMWGGDHDGGQGEAVRVPFADATLVELPMTEDDERLPAMLALADVMSTGHYAIANGRVQPGSTVAVIGDGAVGLCAVLAASGAGADHIFLLSTHEARSRVGRTFGATEIVAARGDEATASILELTGGAGADAVLDCVGTQQALDTAIGGVRAGGAVVLAGAPHAGLHSTHEVFLRNLTVTGGLAPARVIIPQLLGEVLAGRLDPSPVFDLTVALDAVPDAYQQMSDRTAIKALIRM